MVVRVLWLWLVLAATAYADPRTDAGLVWQAPVSCPDIAEVRARIERRLGTSMAAAARGIDRAVHGIEVDIAPDGDGNDRRFVAHVDLRGVTVANEIRVLTSAGCDELTDAVAVIIARIASENRQPLAEQRGDRGRLVVEAPPPAAPRVWGGGLRALGVSGIGALPGVSVAGEMAAYVRRRSLFVELAGVRWLLSPRDWVPGGRGQVDVSLDVAALRFGWGSEQLPLRAWVAGEIGSVEGQSVVVDDRHVGAARWVGAGAGFGVAWPMTLHTRLIGIVELVVPLQRARFVVQQGMQIYPGTASAHCGFGLEVGWR